MSDFSSVFPAGVKLDPNKRVNYEHGLVLGVDEFNQQEYYLLEKDRLHNRSLHGYGTVCGLQVTQESIASAVTEIKVSPGLAVSSSGQFIQVPRQQCARLEDWLSSHTQEVAELIDTSPPQNSISVYLMLCYRQCKTDFVPIPSGPCQSLEETTAASRIADDFSLTFELQAPPSHHFQSSMQQLADLLLSLPVEAGGAMTLDDIKELVRGLKPDAIVSSPPLSSPSSPPISDAIAPENVDEFFTAAFLVWVTEVKPCLIKEGIEIVPAEAYQQCVFLAQFNLEVEIVDGVARLQTGSDVVIDESQRQFLLPTQGLQDYLGPLSFWAKSLADFHFPSSPATPVVDSELVHLDGDETIVGSKTFNAPIILAATGRVRKTISMPGHHAHHGTGAARALFADTLPSLHFMTSGSNAFAGEAVFSIPIPVDIDYSEMLRFRLLWGFRGAPEPSDISFDWRVGARFFEANDSVPGSPFEFVTFNVSELSARRNDVLVTDFHEFDSNIVLTGNHQYGAMHISIDDPGVAIPQVYLLQVELEYIASRLGRSVTP